MPMAEEVEALLGSRVSQSCIARRRAVVQGAKRRTKTDNVHPP